MKGICLGHGQKEGGCVFFLYNRAVHYIGKASITRKSGEPGIPARLVEHMRCVYCQSVSCAGKPRYKLKRMYLNSIRFVPVLLVDTTRKALAFESVAIAVENPEFPGVLGLQAACHDLYKLQQQHEYAVGYGEGPLWLFAPERKMLFLSFLCSTAPNVRIPNWPRNDKARFIYRAVEKLPELMHSTYRKKVVLTNLQYLLRNLFMPPARIPRLSLPAWVSFPGTHKVRKVLQNAMQRIRSNPIRQWILKQIRVVREPPRRWRAELNAKRVMSEFCRADFEDWSVQEFEELLKLQSLHAIRAPLRLPQFPTGKTSQKQLSRAWAVWANLTRIPPRAFQHGSRRLVP